MHLFLNGLGASTSSGLTYIRNIVPELASRRDVKTTLALNASLRNELRGIPNTSLLPLNVPSAAAARFYMEQTALPRIIRQSKADVLLSTGNFALRHSPIPQILLSGNSLYTSREFYRDLIRRKAWGLWLDTRVKSFFARRSIHWADVTVAPSQSFAKELSQWSSRPVQCIYHGFDPAIFAVDNTPLPADVQGKIDSARGALKLLFVSHYNYFRNFETLFRAIPILRSRLEGRELKLFLTCRLGMDEPRSSFRSAEAASLVTALGISDHLVELGPVEYRSIHHVYRSCDVYVTPAYAETFAHPLIEAMACGRPVVASDIPVHQEICAGSALHFSTFSPEQLAGQVYRLCEDPALRSQCVTAGQGRASEFSWKKHVDELLAVAEGLCREKL